MQARVCGVKWEGATYFSGCPTWSCWSELSFYDRFLRGSKINPWAWSSLCLKGQKFGEKSTLKLTLFETFISIEIFTS